jgi:tartrate-resistant acid phosphatase type 5
MHRVPLVLFALFATTGLALAFENKPEPPKPTSRPVVREYSMRPLPPGQVNILASGDWGENTKEQKHVSETMSGYVTSTGLQFNCAISVGDNAYIKLKGVDDYMWQMFFEDMYDARTLNFPWYLTLGNHDYEGDKAKLEILYTQKNPNSRWKLPAHWYRMDLPAEKPLVTLLLLDSNKPRLTLAEWQEQTRWLEEQLKGPRARWTLSVCHHPMFSNGAHGDIGVLQVEWGELFKRYGLDFYVAGHDHDLQHLEPTGWPMTFLQVGGGARKLTDMRRDSRGPFSRKLYGFAHLQFFADKAHVTYVDGTTGKVAHEFVRAKSGQVEVVRTTGRDRPSTRPLRVIQGIEDPDPDRSNTSVQPKDLSTDDQ